MLSLLLAWLWFFHSPYEPLAIDFRVLHRVGSEDISNLYPHGGMSPFVYPPTAILWFSFFDTLEFWPAFWLWGAASALAFFFACRALWGWKIAALSLLSVASFQGLLLGQPSMMLGALILTAFALPDKWQDVRGLLIGVVLAFKPQLAFLAPLLFIVRKEWIGLFWMTAVVILLALESLLLYGVTTWQEWINALPLFHQVLVVEDVLIHTIAPAAKAEFYGLHPLPFWLLGAAIACAAIVQYGRRLERGYLAALLVAASLMAAPYALPHDTMVLIPASLAVMLTRRDWRVLPALLILVGWLVAPALFALWAIVTMQAPLRTMYGRLPGAFDRRPA
jgi:hypothetical protein